MKNLLIGSVTISILFLSACSDAPQINTGTLLSEMINRDLMPEFPNPAYTTRQFSSYDRKSISPDKPGWFANADRSQFIRIDRNEQRREFVMFDADGPGAIVRFWITVARYEGKGILRIYIDGKKEPELEGEVLSMMSGGGIVDPPLASSVSELTDYSQRGHNLYLPIPYSQHCKITYESDGLTEEPGAETGEAFYYNINYRSYAEEVSMGSFTRNDLQTYAVKLQIVQQSLSGQYMEAKQSFEVHEQNGLSLQPDQSVTLQTDGEKAIRRFSVKLNAAKYEQALRSTVLEIQFDGQQTVWCPIGDFFGTGYKLSPYKSWYTEVLPDRTLSCQWVMPFSKSAVVTIRNHGDQEVAIENFLVETANYTWTDRTMHFGAGWFEQNRLQTQREGENEHGEVHGHFDVNYVTLSGKGVLVGNGVTLFNTIDAWWGEGDEKIFVDDEPFPSHFGTGTEDFYGYAWSKPENFQHPYIAQPDGAGAQTSGHVVNLRYRALDAIPFTRNLKVDMEMWHWLNTTINHAPVSYWYMMPGGTSNVKPLPVAAKNPVALSRMDFFLDGYSERNIFLDETVVKINGHDHGYEIRYTLDGTNPTKNSRLYERPFKLNKSKVVKSIGFSPFGHTTAVLEGNFIKQIPKKSFNLTNPKNGLEYDYFELDEILDKAEQLSSFKKTSTGSVSTIRFPDVELPGLFGLIFKGCINVPAKGIYTFSTNSNDGSMLYVHDELVVNNDGGHTARERFGQVALGPGYHPIRLEYIQIGGGKLLEVYVEGPGVDRHQIKPQELFY